MNEKANYGNWVPEKMLYLIFGLAKNRYITKDVPANKGNGNLYADLS